MEARTPENFFEDILPKRFKPENAVGINVTVQINIINAKRGNWTVAIKNQKLQTIEGIHPSPDLLLEMKEEDYMNLVNGKISGERAFMTGKIRFKGSIALALKLRQTGFL